MVSYFYVRHLPNGERYVRGHCMEGDTMPTEGIANGSGLLEMDTGKQYYYDAEGKEWVAPTAESDAQNGG